MGTATGRCKSMKEINWEFWGIYAMVMAIIAGILIYFRIFSYITMAMCSLIVFLIESFINGLLKCIYTLQEVESYA